MIPLKDYNPTRNRIVVVLALIAVNVFMFLFVQPSLGATDAEQAAFIYCKASIPYEVTHHENIVEAALDEGGDAIVRSRGENGEGVAIDLARECPRKSVVLSILRSMFLHGGLLHIASNMLFLWVFGNNVEDRLGRVRFTIFYLLCGLAATLAQSYVDPDSLVPLVGASGAIAGVLGAYIVMFPRALVRTIILLPLLWFFPFNLPAVVVLGVWFLTQIWSVSVGSATGGAGGVAYMAHIGGFVAGVVLLFLMRPRRSPEPASSPFDYPL